MSKDAVRPVRLELTTPAPPGRGGPLSYASTSPPRMHKAMPVRANMVSIKRAMEVTPGLSQLRNCQQAQGRRNRGLRFNRECVVNSTFL